MVHPHRRGALANGTRLSSSTQATCSRAVGTTVERTVGAWALSMLSIGVAAQSVFIGLVLLPRNHPAQWQEARSWLLAGVLALAGALFLAGLMLSRSRRRRR